MTSSVILPNSLYLYPPRYSTYYYSASALPSGAGIACSVIVRPAAVDLIVASPCGVRRLLSSPMKPRGVSCPSTITHAIPDQSTAQHSTAQYSTVQYLLSHLNAATPGIYGKGEVPERCHSFAVRDCPPRLAPSFVGRAVCGGMDVREQAEARRDGEEAAVGDALTGRSDPARAYAECDRRWAHAATENQLPRQVKLAQHWRLKTKLLASSPRSLYHHAPGSAIPSTGYNHDLPELLALRTLPRVASRPCTSESLVRDCDRDWDGRHASPCPRADDGVHRSHDSWIC